MTAHYSVHGRVAVIELDNPPVNGMGLETRTACVAAIERAVADTAMDAIVLAGAGKVFSGGADIREFDSPKALTEPTLHTLIRTAEQCSKPIVAAIHGVCMGGGLELSLGCQYRVALADAQVALPEVKLGLLPGAGGTQRLPRAVGLARALSMIVSGAPVKAGALAGTKLFDRVLAPGTDLRGAAVEFAAQIAAVRPLPLVRHIPYDEPDAQDLLEQARQQVAAQSGALPAPVACVDAIAMALSAPSFDEGLVFERDQFLRLRETVESKALRHAFFAERASAKVADLPNDIAPRALSSAAVIGAGTMGSGIAACFIAAGIPVTLIERDAQALERGVAAVRAVDERQLAKGRIDAAKFASRQALLTASLALDDAAGADVVIEAVSERMPIKLAVFQELDRIARPGALLATNTSTLDINRIAAATTRAHDVIGLHFFSPAPVMPLLEVVRADATGHDALATALALARKLKKTPVVARVCDGFIGNRMLASYLDQAWRLLEEGALPEQVDAAIERFGFAMGPFAMSDLAGNDVGWHIRRQHAEDGTPVHAPLADLLCEQGRLGQKAGAGWYDYPDGPRSRRPSATVHGMIRDYMAREGKAARQIGDEEINERLVWALVNEGARILDEGIAQRASDIDIVYLYGYGFPRHRGGPMFYADTVGLDKVVDALRRHAGCGIEPAPLLVRLAAQGRGFNA